MGQSCQTPECMLSSFLIVCCYKKKSVFAYHSFQTSLNQSLAFLSDAPLSPPPTTTSTSATPTTTTPPSPDTAETTTAPTATTTTPATTQATIDSSEKAKRKKSLERAVETSLSEIEHCTLFAKLGKSEVCQT